MKPNDMFLKVEMTAYFSVNGLNIEKKEFANDSDLNGIYLNGKKISPEIYYYLEEIKDHILKLEELPESMKLELDSANWKEEFVSRAQIWEKDPSAREYDEFMEKQLSKTENDKNE